MPKSILKPLHGYNTRSATKRKGSRLEKSSPKRVKLTAKLEVHSATAEERLKGNSHTDGSSLFDDEPILETDAESNQLDENRPPSPQSLVKSTLPATSSCLGDSTAFGSFFGESTLFSSETSIFGNSSLFSSDYPTLTFGAQRQPLSSLFNQDDSSETFRTEEEIQAEIDANAARAKIASVSKACTFGIKKSDQRHMDVYRQLLRNNKWCEATHTRKAYSAGLVEKMDCMPKWAAGRKFIGYCSIFIIRSPVGRYLFCAAFRSRHLGNPLEKDRVYLGKTVFKEFLADLTFSEVVKAELGFRLRAQSPNNCIILSFQEGKKFRKINEAYRIAKDLDELASSDSKRRSAVLGKNLKLPETDIEVKKWKQFNSEFL